MNDEGNAWKLRAACRGAAAPGCRWWSGNADVHVELSLVCRACPVFKECQDYSYRVRPTGVFQAGRWWG